MKGADGQTFAGAVEGDGFLFHFSTFDPSSPFAHSVFGQANLSQWSVVSGRCGYGVLLALVKMFRTGQKGVAIVTRQERSPLCQIFPPTCSKIFAVNLPKWITVRNRDRGFSLKMLAVR